VRLVLRCLKELAERESYTVILIRHLNKSGGQKALYRGRGSIGIVGLARAALYVGPTPEGGGRGWAADATSETRHRVGASWAIWA
jgi:hypothetical protein